MIKKPTLIVLICAVLVVGGLYYFTWRSSKHPSSSPDATKPAFTLSADDVTSLTLSHPDKPGDAPIHLEKNNNGWKIVQPLDTDADRNAVGAITSGLADAQVSGNEPGTADRLKVYGLEPAHLSVRFETKSGAKHSVELGNKDFTGGTVYARVDDGNGVDLLPASLLGSADKSVDNLRDLTVLHLIPLDVRSFTLKNSSGEIAVSREKSGWQLTKPHTEPADETIVNDLLNAVSDAKMSTVASEQPSDLGKYGLTSPAISFSATDNAGKVATLLVGRKQDNEYYSRDVSRPMIFRINGTLAGKLDEKYDAFRDKKLSELQQDDVARIDLHDPNGMIVLSHDGDKWTFDAPPDEKGKEAEPWKIFSGIANARAVSILDQPPADVRERLAKPEIELTLTEEGGGQCAIQISAATGDFVYARVSDRKPAYKLSNQIIQSLNLKASDVAF